MSRLQRWFSLQGLGAEGPHLGNEPPAQHGRGPALRLWSGFPSEQVPEHLDLPLGFPSRKMSVFHVVSLLSNLDLAV